MVYDKDDTWTKLGKIVPSNLESIKIRKQYGLCVILPLIKTTNAISETLRTKMRDRVEQRGGQQQNITHYFLPILTKRVSYNYIKSRLIMDIRSRFY
jgi:hypothetical protein